MNQRIQELAEHAGLKYYNWSTNESNIIDGEFKYPRLEDYEKFARLIVAECLKKIESQRSSGENADQWTITRDLCYHNMMTELKQHFGVE